VEGTPFGRYRLIELLGRGGMGEVWRAHDTVTDRVVAIKLLPASFSENVEFQQRFRREAHAAARLNTPHVIPIYDYGDIDGRLFVSMRLIEGRDLETALADGPIEPARAVRIIEGVALALQAAHKVGLLHRDVKPSNILLDENDFAYLIDFGIARAADQTRLTQSGNTIGTFAYIAPERLDTRAEEDARADIYSLACVLYECLTGHPPFDADTTPQLIAAHLHTAPPQPSTTQPNVPARFDQVIATGMAKNPYNRYATTVELADAAHDAITTLLARPSEPTLLAEPPAPAPESTVLDPGSTTPAPSSGVQQQAADLNLAATQQRPPDDGASWSPQSAAPKRPLVRVATVVPALLAIVLVAAAAFATIEAVRTNRLASHTVPAWQPYVDAAKVTAVDLTSMSYQTVDNDVQRVLDNSTGTFHDDFSKSSEVFKQAVRDAQSVSSGTVSGAGLESIEGTQARVLVAVSEKTTKAANPNAETKSWRMRISVDKMGQSYKASSVEFVP
jgi:serine/threonine protein kinase